MRLGEIKLICMRHEKSRKKKFSGLLLLTLIMLLLVYSVIFFINTVRPVLSSIATSKAQYLGNMTINHAVGELFSENTLTEEDFYTFSRDEAGQIAAMTANTVEITRLKSKVAVLVQQRLADIKETRIQFPLSALTGSNLFAGVGPYVRAEFMPVNSVFVDFESKFDSSGINQTRLQVNLTVRADVMLLMPTLRCVSKTEVSVPVVQTIIVGEVPESYINIDHTKDGSYIDDALEVMPN